MDSPDRAASGCSRRQLAEDLTRLGLRSGVDILVHSSLKKTGWIEGGPKTLLRALSDALGPSATIVVPTCTEDNSQTSPEFRSRTTNLLPEELRSYLDDMPGFDPERSPSTNMGIFAEFVRTRPESMRSQHPQSSLAALGPAAAEVVGNHPLNTHLGPGSPMSTLYDRRAQVLLIGVGFEKNTAFHLAEYSLPARLQTFQAKICTPRQPLGEWVRFDDRYLDASDFGAIGADMQKCEWVRSGVVGSAQCFTFPFREAVSFAETWMSSHRTRWPE
jgi:aminoglycoside 3-N-acetyltransferase